jgi:MGT family glycosyltransferase
VSVDREMERHVRDSDTVSETDHKGSKGRILFTVTPIPGHIDPMLAIASHLRDQGHRIVFNTGTVFRKRVESLGLAFAPLNGKANFDYRTFNKFIPEGQTISPGTEERIHNAQRVFGDTLIPQCEGVRKLLSCERFDLVLNDFTFFGVFPLLLGPRKERPPIVSVSVSPIVLSSIDASPFSHATTTEDRERVRKENARFQEDLIPAVEYLNGILHSYHCRTMPGFYFDCIYTMPDLLLQLSIDALEFPRSDMPTQVKFVGPVMPPDSGNFDLPCLFDHWDDSTPVVLVTQGTLANGDLTELIVPTITSLADEEVTVIATTGKSADVPTSAYPANARVVPYVPFLKMLPKVDVFVTNGGFGAVNQALSMGVPIVVAGETEDKAFVASRVAWTGAGISLGTSRPTPKELQLAVRQIMQNDSYRAKARLLQRRFAQYNALESISSYVNSILECA